jgi:hypothetical protein
MSTTGELTLIYATQGKGGLPGRSSNEDRSEDRSEDPSEDQSEDRSEDRNPASGPELWLKRESWRTLSGRRHL